ncbi:MAG: HAD family hydrolase [Acidimicrobiales bacterium]|jgi:HAD superfamily hydrolase (TIGR01549 family)|nr:HAD family hydrolase [Acidimicrobiales bacterium]
MAKIRAVTFDLWNTLLTSSPGAVEIRSRFWSEVIDERGLEIDADLLHGTLSMLPDRFDEEWRAGRQYGPTEALADCFTAFGDRLTSEDRDALAAAFEAASYELKVAPVADAADVLSAVAATGVAVGIISDTALATGRHLRTYLDAYGIFQHVTFAAFSDEVGVYKPDPAIFAAALDGLGIGDPATAAHVGDLKRTDVAGARAMGMSTVRFRGVVDDPEDGAEADHVIDRLADLPRVLGPG